MIQARVGIIPVPDPTKGARIVVQVGGPATSVLLRHVPSDWVIVCIGRGIDLAARVAKLRRAAVKRGDAVDGGFTVEDGNPIIDGMMTS